MTDVPRPVDLAGAFARIPAPFQPRIAGRVNDHEVRLAKIHGEFPWHHHADEDELFLCVRGRFTVEFRGGPVELAEGQLLVVPRGVEHRTRAEEEAWALLVQPAGLRNTGNVVDDHTFEATDL